VKFGLFYQLPCAEWQSPLQRYQDTLDQIQLGDELGFDYAWLAELHFDPKFSITPSPLMVAAAAAQRTKRIRLGVAVNVLPLHNPVRIAEDIATLDLLSNGRAEFGIGRGALPLHFQGFNIPQEENRERFMEGLEFVVKALTQDEFSFEGKHYSAENLRLVPKPLQKPHPPIRIASNSPDTFELVGELGYPIFATPVIVPLPQLRKGVKTYREKLAANGYPITGEELSLAIPTYVAKHAREAEAVPESSVMNYMGAITASFDTPLMQRAIAASPIVKETQARFLAMTYENWYNNTAIFGDPARCLEKLQALRDEFQPGEFICWFNQGGLIPHSDVAEAMRLFAEEVMPHFR
jgi:alkanesulfonate monooxygenase SsuD/methylene tetrahydromethanopterin reductase-like flavin-dependent oxidoreductase (luciferase family)